MIRVGDGTWWGGKLRGGVVVLAMLHIGGSATSASAETLVFRNDCKAPVVVQVVSVFHGVFRRDRPYLLHPGDITKPGVALIGDKVITISDAKVPNRILYQGAVPSSPLDRHFRIVPDGPHVHLLPQAASPE
ncbi:MAG TPA: hypothetical protein VH643_10910 [Gemmataceae bacterium]|jgi:hypothetical protein